MPGSMTWEDPPPTRGHGYNWTEIAQTLKSNPERWLRVFEEGPLSLVNAIRQASVLALTPINPGRVGRTPEAGEGRFEVRTRNNKPGPPRTCSLYLRWVPPTTERS